MNRGEECKVGECGQVTLPKELREKFDIHGGDEVIIHEENGKIILEKSVCRDELAEGTLSMPMSPDKPLALLDATDIGKTVGMALADRERFAGKTIELAGDNRTPTELAAALSEVLDHEVTHVRPEVENYRAMAGDEMTEMYGWFEEVGYGPNPMADAEAYGIEPNDFASFLSNSDTLMSLPPAA